MIRDGLTDKLQDILKQLRDDGVIASITMIRKATLDEAHCDVCRYKTFDDVFRQSATIAFDDYITRRENNG